MADKAHTLPQSRRSSFSLTPKLRKSANKLLPSMPTLRRSSLVLFGGKSGIGDSYRDTIDTCSIGSNSASATPASTPSSSPRPPKSRRFSVFSKSPKDEKGADKKKTLKRTLSKGGKLLLPKFSFKEESVPFMVETEGDLHRASIVDDNLLTVKPEECVSDDSTSKAESCHSDEVCEGEWSVADTCKRVRKLSVSGIHGSIYTESQAMPNEDGKEVEDPFDGDPETLSHVSNVSNSSARLAETKSTNGEDSYFSFGRKSPSTLKREIMQITDNQTSEGNQYIAAKLERKSSTTVSTCDRSLLLEPVGYKRD